MKRKGTRQQGRNKPAARAPKKRKGGTTKTFEVQTQIPPGEQCPEHLTVRLGAVQIAAGDFKLDRFLELPGFQLIFDHRWQMNRESRAYDHFCQFSDDRTKIDVVYEANFSWMPPRCVTISTDSPEGLRPSELGKIVDLLPERRLLKVSLAHDFSSASGVNEQFVRAHLLVGRNQAQSGTGDPDALWFGTRKSPICARCFFNESGNAYTVVVDFRRPWLKRNGIEAPADFPRLPGLTFPNPLPFYEVNMAKLSAAFAGRKGRLQSILRKVVTRQGDLHDAVRYLRHEVKLRDIRRFLNPLPINQSVEDALRAWAHGWEKPSDSKAQ